MPKIAEKDAPTTAALSTKARTSAMEGAPVEQIRPLTVTSKELGGAPMQVPPSEAQLLAAEEVGIAAWHNGKKITALWSNSSMRNSYIAVDGLGWKKLANAYDSSTVSMSMLASHAEQTNATCNIRIEADGMVHEIYVW